MVEVAREKLRDRAAPADLRPGNLLERKSYSFEGLSGGFDLVFTYDVVQQLPRAAQAATCRRMVAALAPGGVAVIFDNERSEERRVGNGGVSPCRYRWSTYN